jgi:hypothetical protein
VSVRLADTFAQDAPHGALLSKDPALARGRTRLKLLAVLFAIGFVATALGTIEVFLAAGGAP